MKAGVHRDVGRECFHRDRILRDQLVQFRQALFQWLKIARRYPSLGSEPRGKTFEHPAQLVESRMSRSVNALTMNPPEESLPEGLPPRAGPRPSAPAFATRRWSRRLRAPKFAHRTAAGRKGSDRVARAGRAPCEIPRDRGRVVHPFTPRPASPTAGFPGPPCDRSCAAPTSHRYRC